MRERNRGAARSRSPVSLFVPVESCWAASINLSRNAKKVAGPDTHAGQGPDCHPIGPMSLMGRIGLIAVLVSVSLRQAFLLGQAADAFDDPADLAVVDAQLGGDLIVT